MNKNGYIYKYYKYKSKYLKYKYLTGGYDKRIVENMYEYQPLKINKYCECVVTDMDNDILCRFTNTYDTVTKHAEINCVKFLIENDFVEQKINLYLTKSPCVKCFHILKNLNIQNIYYIYEYQDDYRNYISLDPGIYFKNINNYKINDLDIELIDVHENKPSNIPTNVFYRTENINIDLYDSNNNLIESIYTNDIIKCIFDIYKQKISFNKIVYNNGSQPIAIENLFFAVMNIEYVIL